MEKKQRKLLLELRSRLVGEMHVQPFTIYNDVTIEELLRRKPRTLEDLSEVKGFPKTGKRIKGFGELVVAIFNNTDSISEIEVNVNGKDAGVSCKLKQLASF